jgi:hypothetical protein
MPTANSDRGAALLTVLLLLTLVAAMLAGFSTVVMTDQRVRGVDRTRTRAFYAAHGALEQLTADLGNLFLSDFAPTSAEVRALAAEPPTINGVRFETADGRPGYTVEFAEDGNGMPAIEGGREGGEIVSGPFQGLRGPRTTYTLKVTARTLAGADGSTDVRLVRTMNTVSIPVFQFGIFSETDLSFFAGPDFNFGGRVHTNGDLFLAQKDNNTLQLSDRVTAVGEVIRTNLSNGLDTARNSYRGNIRITQGGGSFRDLGMDEGSLHPKWTDLSIGSYHGNLRNSRTGARALSLPLVSFGADPIDLIRRGVPGEDPRILQQRFYSLASLRILLSDDANTLQSLPGATANAPASLDAAPFALSSGSEVEGYRSPPGTPLIGGQLKIEMQRQNGTWQDVTAEILALGVTGRNLPEPAPAPAGAPCADPSPAAIIRVQRVRQVPSEPFRPCGINSPDPTDYWPNVLYDAREGNLRDDVTRDDGTMRLGGVVHYVELDVANLARWFRGEIGASGANARNINGYTVYFSDRRTNRNARNEETGEYGFEDVVNPGSPNGTPDGQLQKGEDVNKSDTLDTYGAVARVPQGATVPLTADANPSTVIPQAGIAQANRAILFRRGLKLTNGGLGNLIEPGLTIASENPVYVQGNYNADATGFGNPHVAAAIIADAVTLLSNAWNDNTSFTSPNDPAGRPAVETWYRMAIIAGKGVTFPRPDNGNPPLDFGTDGGVHNFLRYLENWSDRRLNFRGALASFYFNRQAVGTYKCCQNVYSPPTRVYAFDTDFLLPNLLPPHTPMFRDVNTTGFTQVIR